MFCHANLLNLSLLPSLLVSSTSILSYLSYLKAHHPLLSSLPPTLFVPIPSLFTPTPLSLSSNLTHSLTSPFSPVQSCPPIPVLYCIYKNERKEKDGIKKK